METEQTIFLAAVSQRVDVVESYGEVRDALDQNLVRWLHENGVTAVPVPNTLVQSLNEEKPENSSLEEWLNRIQPDGIILSGGNNIGDFPVRDETEKTLIRWAEKEKLPLLGICRGMQMMGHLAGAELQPVEGHVRTRHRLNPEAPHTWPASVNSFHDFGLRECPTGYELIASSQDGNPEAIRHQALPWEGWMWHPEREEAFAREDGENLKRLFGLKH